MAKVLRKHKFGPTPSGRESIYRWDDWLDGRIWQLTKGKDFNCLTNSMRVQAYARARERQLRVRTTIHGDTLIIQRQ